MAASAAQAVTVLPNLLVPSNQPDLVDIIPLHRWLIDIHRQLDTYPPVPKSKLCEVCSRIPLNTIFSRTARSTFTIGDISEVESRQHCALCRLCKAYMDSIAGNPEFEHWLALPSPCIFQLQSRTPMLYNGPPDDDADWAFLPVPMDIFLGPYASLDLYKADQYDEFKDRPPKFIIQHRLVFGPSRLLATTDKGSFLSRGSLERLMDGALACRLSHRSCDGLSHPISHSLVFRLIDVQDRTVRLADQHSEYVALSYIWGQSGGRNHGQLESHPDDPDVKKLPRTLPQTIKDVIQVVQWLGVRYVWIDAYCIQQDDSVELQNAVMHMDSVYENGLLTICPFWADSAAGLHGVSVPFKDQNCRPLGDDYLCSSFPYSHPLNDEIVETPWHSRGWIFQESVLSRQRLCFMPSSVMLLCNEQSLSSHCYARKATSASYRSSFSDVQVRQCLRNMRWDFGIYQAIVSSYTARTLSHPSDALNAIRGILNRITKQTGMEFVQGLPKADVWNGLTWVRGSVIRRDSPWRTGRVECRRRLIFPSWSWLDQDVSSSYELWLSTPYEHLVAQSRATLHVTSPTGKSFEVLVSKVARISFDTRCSDPTRLLIKSEVAEARITQGSPEKFPRINEFMWRAVHPKGDAFMDTFHAWLTWNSPVSGMLLDTRAIDALDVDDGIARVRLVLLAEISAVNHSTRDGRREIGDTVIAMAIAGLDGSATTERLGIIAVPLFYWLDSKPKLGEVVVV